MFFKYVAVVMDKFYFQCLEKDTYFCEKSGN